MGGAVSITTHDSVKNSVLRHLLTDEAALIRLYEDIGANQTVQAGRVNIKGQISLPEVITYFKNSTEPAFSGFVDHANIAKQALKFVATHTKKKKYKDQISQKQFRLFLSTMFLFAHLWKIFESNFDNDVDDKRIFKHEYIRARGMIRELEGVVISEDVTEEAWENEFSNIDKNGGGFVTFGEFCSYATKFIITPLKYAEEILDDNDPATEDDVVTDEVLLASDHINETNNTADAAEENAGPVEEIVGSVEEQLGEEIQT